MAELFKVNAPVRKPLFEGVQGENEARSIQFDIEPWVTELGDGVVTATAKRSQDSQPYPVTVTKDGNIVTWKPTSTDTAYAGVGSFQLEYTVDSVLAKTCIWSTMVAPSLDPAGDPPDPYDNWLAEMRQIAADALQDAQDADASAQDAEAWTKGTKNGTPVPSTADQYENNAKYWAEQSLANQYGAYIVKSASGEIASFSDGADDVPMKSLNVTITPKQSGSGDPSPSNVRPISGTSTANVTVKGKNLYNPAVQHLNANYVTLNGDTFTMTWDDGGVRIFGKWGAVLQGFPKGRYTLQFIGTNVTYLRAQLMRASNDTSIMSVSNGQTFTVDEDFYINIYGSYAHPDTAVFKVQLETGETATDYEPYVDGHTTPVPLGQTVYGGTVDATTGVLRVTHKYVEYDGSNDENWMKFQSGSAAAFAMRIIVTDVKSDPYHTPVKSNRLKSITAASSWGSNDNWIAESGGQGIYTGIQTITTVDAWRTWLSENPLQVVYELATPTTVQLTPTEVRTLLGQNNVWADCGSVEVEYRADPTLAYNELAQVIVSLGGNL